MNWDAIGAIGEIVGALAVVLSLIYLATQIRASNSVAQRDSRLKSSKIGHPQISRSRIIPAFAISYL